MPRLPDAEYHYAVSKKAGELLVEQYSNQFPCSVVRFAAVFSDWCELAPLYKFLSSWLDSKKIESKILAGKGESAIPYIHIRDLCQMFQIIFAKTEELPAYDVYNASPNGSTSHKEIFQISTRYVFGEQIKSVHLPELLAYPALILRRFLKIFKLTSKEPFEQFWMVRYLDKKLNVDSTYTQLNLGWQPTTRYQLKRRLLFLLEKIKSHPDEWRVKNEAALYSYFRSVFSGSTSIPQTGSFTVRETPFSFGESSINFGAGTPSLIYVRQGLYQNPPCTGLHRN